MDFSKLFSLEGKIALITGGSRGIGEMLVEGYLAAGCERVYITARKAQQVEETATKFGERVVGLPGDLSREGQCAGRLRPKHIHEMTRELPRAAIVRALRQIARPREYPSGSERHLSRGSIRPVGSCVHRGDNCGSQV